MSKELVISSNRHETRVALLEDDQLVEVYFQRANEYSLAGSIHKGRVTRVLPGMQSAFVDLGLERDTFLYVSDFLEEEHEDIDRVTGDERPPREGGREGNRDRDRDRDRERRPAMRPPQEPVAAVSAPVGEEVPAAVSGVAETAPPAGAAPTAGGQERPSAGGQDRGEDRDRRGRRSRRRRNRGRGFPESKYAEVGPASANAGPRPAEAESETEAVEPAAPATMGRPETREESRTEIPLVLPGESLAKYRGGPPPHVEHAVEHARPAAVPPPLPTQADLDKAELDEVELDVQLEQKVYEEPIHYPPENALPDAPSHSAPDGSLSSVGHESHRHIPTPPPLPHAGVEAVSAQEAEDLEDAAQSGPITAPMLDEDEDLDIQAMILGEANAEEADDEETAEGESETEVEAGGEVAAAAEGAAETTGAEPASGTAEVRERGGRFPHRVSRRNRRRGGRGGDRPDNRGPREHGTAEQTARAPRPEGEERGPRPEGERPRGRERVLSAQVQQISIADLLKEGQEIIVQIAKEPLGQKGARITSHIALPGRFVVYMPTLEHMGVSRKIASDEERFRLKRILQGKRPGPVGGFITRTAAEGRTEEEIAGDMEFLYNLWADIRNKADKKPAPALLHHDLDIVQRILRDQLGDSFKAIWIDNEETYESVLRFVERFQPALVGKVKMYTREAPIFDAFSVTSELEKALRPKVWLKSGGFIVINQTEALVAIDVNTGKYVGKTNRLEDTIVKTNTEAIKEIVRQVRLRDLGGIIVIDFIDMDERKNRTKVMQVLEEAMRADRAPYKILQFNDFGLVAITRKRVKQSLERTLCSPCPHCDGAGYIKSVQTVVSEILAEARKMAGSVEGKEVVLRVHADVAKVLKSHQNKYLEELEEVLRRPVLIKSDSQLHHEKFDLA
ncbi:MAG: Rne/Rng family ribonuclease [Acidobacteriia bacterium]|nr:Rne/Rng family ribonuclease [Terriglobia bacterium]